MFNKYLDIIKKKGSAGFTLMELLIVISIIGILVTIVVIAVDPAAILQRSNDTRRRADLNQIKVALQLYFNENNDYPTDSTTTDEFADDTGAANSPPNLTPTYMNQLPDWWNADGEYGTNGTDYDAGVDLERPNTEDGNSKTGCEDNTLITWGDSHYIVCPD